MPLIKCSECDKEISDEAVSCPSCGAPSKTAKRKKRGNIQGVGCLTLMLAGILVFLFPPLGFFFLIIGFIVLIYGLVA